MPNWAVLALGLVISLSEVASEKIIFFHHMVSYSHRLQTWPLAEALAEKGHQVTYISPYYPKDPNPKIKELVAREHEEVMTKILNAEMDINLKIRREIANLGDIMWDAGIDICRTLFTSPDFKSWLKANPKADLVIIDNCLPECGIGLAYRLGAKYIFFATIPLHAHEYDSIGFLPQPSAIPELETYTLRTPLGFLDRVSNTLESLRWRWKHYYHYAPQIDELIRKELKVEKMPYIEDMLRNTSLIFYTGDGIIDYPRSLPPLFVNVAGIHAKKSEKPLPKEMENFISSNISTKLHSISEGEPDDGFIYISFGSLIVSSNLPPHIKKIFFDVIASFPHIKFLWKWNGDNFPKEEMARLKNLHLSKWYPQIDILGHNKIRAFVSQCGKPSMTEALFNGVPMICFPTFGDQEINAGRMNELGAMVRLDIATVTYEDLRQGVERVLYDSNLKGRTSRLQKLFLDRPMTPLDTAIWFTEFVLRNEDISHLRPAGNDQYWFVRRQVDVWAFISISIFVLFVVFVLLMLKTMNRFMRILHKPKYE